MRKYAPNIDYEVEAIFTRASHRGGRIKPTDVAQSDWDDMLKRDGIRKFKNKVFGFYANAGDEREMNFRRFVRLLYKLNMGGSALDAGHAAEKLCAKSDVYCFKFSKRYNEGERMYKVSLAYTI